MLAIFDQAEAAKVRVWVRSVWLRGALASPDAQCPAETKRAADRARRRQLCSWATWAELALRYALSFRQVTGVVIGPRTESELLAAVAAAEKGPLTWYRRALLESVAEPPRAVTDPRRWD
jgi:aryl-alcohol dehydrogenase-like predicted oxidoreductase